jgi:photosystem II stability/assembly factor-like uncharacterized protein
MIYCGLFAAFTSLFGQTWTQTGAPTNEYWHVMASSADGSKLLALALYAVYTSTDSGTTWTQNSLPLSENTLYSAASSADGTILAVGDYEYIYISTNSGNTWFVSTNAPEDWWYSIACSADGSKMVAAPRDDPTTGNPQPLYISKDSGITWTATLSPSNYWTAVASSADGTKLIALPSDGPIYSSADSGNSWTSNNIVAYWRSVACSADGTKAVAVSDPGDVYTSTNSGGAWNSLRVFGAGTGLDSVASSADGVRMLAVGDGGVLPIFVSTNSGMSWVNQTNAPQMALWNAVATSADGYKMFAATYALLGNDNSGGVYMLQTTPSPQLNCTPINTNITISWTVPSINFVLQQNVDLTTTNWLTLTNTPLLNFTNLQYQVALLPTNNNAFYRLAVP